MQARKDSKTGGQHKSFLFRWSRHSMQGTCPVTSLHSQGNPKLGLSIFWCWGPEEWPGDGRRSLLIRMVRLGPWEVFFWAEILTKVRKITDGNCWWKSSEAEGSVQRPLPAPSEEQSDQGREDVRKQKLAARGVGGRPHRTFWRPLWGLRPFLQAWQERICDWWAIAAMNTEVKATSAYRCNDGASLGTSSDDPCRPTNL